MSGAPLVVCEQCISLFNFLISQTPVTYDGLKSIPQLHNLEVLNISNHKSVGDELLTQIAISNPNIKVLKLTGCGIDPGHVISIVGR